MVVWFVDDRRARRRLDRPRSRRCSARSTRVTPSIFFRDNGWTGFAVLGAVVLAVTGGEALYADMGHFGKRPIRLAWFALVLPALMLNYFGQGALLLLDAAAASPAVLPAGAVVGAASAGRSRHAGRDHRVAGAHLRRVLADAAGDPARLRAAPRHRAHLVARDGPGLRAAGELGAGHLHHPHRHRLPDRRARSPPPTASPSR